jgi:signal peptidase
VATHRVVAVDGENRQFTTKGDANKSEDAAPVHFNNLIGVPVFAIPLLGYVSAYIQSPPGMYVAIGAGVVLLAVVFLPDLLTKKEKKPENEEKQEDAQ